MCICLHQEPAAAVVAIVYWLLRLTVMLGRRHAATPGIIPAAERTVTLLAFEDANQSPLADLMDVTQRQKTASELNAAILSSQGQVRSHSTISEPHVSVGQCVWLANCDSSQQAFGQVSAV